MSLIQIEDRPTLNRQVRRPERDLLDLPVVRWFKLRYARRVFQFALLIAALILIYDGLAGPQISPKNVATVAVWVDYRAFLIVSLLLVGNLFCMTCPFMLPRTWLKRAIGREWNWPKKLRGHWISMGMLVFIFWAYEFFSLWNSPVATATVTIGYFVAAASLDALFKGAAFCKYVCPIGLFNFAYSLASPTTIKAKSQTVCNSCQTKECIAGSSKITGCETWLYIGKKQGNIDCTLCLDCVRACPHDNIALKPRNPLVELWSSAGRSLDLAILAVLLVGLALVNALGMVAPWNTFSDRITAMTGLPARWVFTLMLLLVGVILPVALYLGGATLGRMLGSVRARKQIDVLKASGAMFIPLSFGIWIGHYMFHFLTGGLTLIPVFQSFLGRIGLPLLGDPNWQLGSLGPLPVVLQMVFPIQMTCVYIGLGVSLYTGYRIGRKLYFKPNQALRGMLPLMMLAVVVALCAIWIFMQPMEMRAIAG